IHVGGGDLTFPHHENEIAQSEAATGKPLANYWLHNGMIIVEGKKMSKSLGNFITIRELLDKFEPMAVRLFILQTQYRKPLDFTEEALATATHSWATLKEGLLFGYQYGKQLGFATNSDNASLNPELITRFKQAVDDDFNFAGGLAILFEIAKNLSKEGNILVHQGTTTIAQEKLEQQWQTLVELAAILGFQAQPETASNQTEGLSDTEIETLLQKRNEARSNKNYAESDRIRDELQTQGITLIDKPGGITIWNRS
ncbi:MAG: DALR domain-containing protein, partial [Waterburya sp.]